MEIWAGDLRLKVDRRTGVAYVPNAGKLAVRNEHDRVIVFVDGKRLEMTTPVAVKVGLALCLGSDEHGANAVRDEVIVFEISGFEVLLLPETAMSIGAAILRKADRADDWQRAFFNTSRGDF